MERKEREGKGATIHDETQTERRERERERAGKKRETQGEIVMGAHGERGDGMLTEGDRDRDDRTR